MFNNLIESSSHAKEFKRRGSFLLFTTATYVVLFVITGVVSIYAYDAHLEEQTTELELLTFVPPPAPETVIPEVVHRNTIQPASNSSAAPSHSIRTELVDSTSNPTNVPKDVGTVASSVPPARADSIIGDRNADPIGPPVGRGVPGGTGTGPVVVDMTDIPPPPPPTTRPVPRVISKGVITSQAISLPKPDYPPIAKRMGIQGSVSVQVLVDETGRVLSAKTLSGSPFLTGEAQKAALQARFSPTILGDQPVKVSGVITYNFVLGR